MVTTFLNNIFCANDSNIACLMKNTHREKHTSKVMCTHSTQRGPRGAPERLPEERQRQRHREMGQGVSLKGDRHASHLVLDKGLDFSS